MKFSINSKMMASTLGAIVRVVDPKAPLIILQNFKVTLTDEGMLTIKGMSTEAEAQQTMATTEHEGAGEFCVNARQLTDFIKKLPDCGVTFAYNGQQLEILAGKGKFVIPVISADAYPQSREVAGDNINIPSQMLIDGLTRTKFAVSTDDFRPTMKGVYFDVLPEKIVFVATDTRVLAKYAFDYATGKTLNFIIPQNIIALVTTMFAKCENVTITLTESSALFEAENLRLIVTLIHGKFPDYNRVIRNSGSFTLDMDKKALISAVSRVRDFGDTNLNYVKISISGMTGDVCVSADDTGMATSGKDYVPCTTECTNLTMGVNADYLLSVLAALQDENVVFSNISEGVVITPMHFVETGEGKDFLALMMPVIVTEG